MNYMVGRWKVAVVLGLALLVAGLAYVDISRAQLKEDEVDFEVLATVTMTKDPNSLLWNLAEKYYGDPYKWAFIKEMNRIPNERKIPVGTVVYIPIEDAKKIKIDLDAEIEAMKAAGRKLSAEIAELQEENRGLRQENKALREKLAGCEEKLKKCEGKGKRLAGKLKEKDATIKELEGMLDNVKSALEKIEAESALEAQAREMRAASEAASKKDRNARVKELESELAKCRSRIKELEAARDQLKAKIKKAAEKKSPVNAPVKKPVDSRSKAAAMAIILVGAIVWIATGN